MELSYNELDAYSKRIDEISLALDLCGEYEEDVRENLLKELDDIVEVIEASERSILTRQKRSHLKICS